MKIDLTGKNILITGGAGDGLGQGICEAVHVAGGRVVISDLDIDMTRKIAGRYEGALAVAGDVSNDEDVARLFGQIKKDIGILHGLVNNAGIGLGKSVLETAEEEYDRLYDVDVKGIWLVTRSFVDQLLKAGERGSIVNISSVQARATMHKMALYAGAKSAVNGLTMGMAVEFGEHNIRCNAVAPGLVFSSQIERIMGKIIDDAAA